MKLKKLTSIAGILSACAVMLASCGGSADTDSSSSAAESSSIAETSSAALSAESSSAESKDDSVNGDVKAPSDITPAMWVVTAPNGNKMTMMGSMHALKDECYPLPQKITDAYGSADVLAVECDTTTMGLSKQMALSKEMTYSDGTSLKDHISERSYNALKEYLNTYNLDISNFEAYKPWALSSTVDALSLNSSKLNADKGVDVYFMKLAHEEDKEIYEVESVDFQMDMLMNFSDDIYDVIFLSYEGESKETQTANMLKLYDVWKNGDLEQIEKLSVEFDTSDSAPELNEEQLKLYEEYENQMLNDRNKVMVQAVKDLLDGDKNVFYIVGAAHFVGDNGILNLLEKDGYAVERIEY